MGFSINNQVTRIGALLSLFVQQPQVAARAIDRKSTDSATRFPRVLAHFVHCIEVALVPIDCEERRIHRLEGIETRECARRMVHAITVDALALGGRVRAHIKRELTRPAGPCISAQSEGPKQANAASSQELAAGKTV